MALVDHDADILLQGIQSPGSERNVQSRCTPMDVACLGVLTHAAIVVLDRCILGLYLH